jgi:hypothetical protein
MAAEITSIYRGYQIVLIEERDGWHWIVAPDTENEQLGYGAQDHQHLALEDAQKFIDETQF